MSRISGREKNCARGLFLNRKNGAAGNFLLNSRRRAQFL
jgi:hypothetical protein